ncbi:MAG TPA: PilZ domain-containing protein [Nitrospira sp.]|nr:PilZ domain-containing protein [Nitrospira sp.]
MSSRNQKDVAEKNPRTTVDSRDAQRVPFYCPVSYTNQDEARRCENKGQLLDLSKKGCRILGPVLAVGCTTTILLELNDGKTPLSIVGATVCWTDGFSFGVKFPTMPVEDRHRLQELVLKLATLRGTSQDRTAFRLA